MPAPTYSPETLLAMVDQPLRSVARRLGVDPAVLCRPLTTNQADRFAIGLGLHPGLVWGAEWWRPGKGGRSTLVATMQTHAKDEVPRCAQTAGAAHPG